MAVPSTCNGEAKPLDSTLAEVDPINILPADVMRSFSPDPSTLNLILESAVALS